MHAGPAVASERGQEADGTVADPARPAIEPEPAEAGTSRRPSASTGPLAHNPQQDLVRLEALLAERQARLADVDTRFFEELTRLEALRDEQEQEASILAELELKRREDTAAIAELERKRGDEHEAL